MSSNNTDKNKQPVKKAANSYSLLLKAEKNEKSSKASKATSVKASNAPKKNNANEDIIDANENKQNAASASTTNGNNQNVASTSTVKKEEIEDPDIPDRSYGDLYCKLCDSHMNSDAMWEAHITGKRHIKNVTKGDTETKYEDLPDVESSVKYEIQNVKDPIVGLTYIHEIRRKEKDVPPIYNCFLCHASIATVPLVIEHVISLKHRLNYIKEKDPDEYQLMEATNLSKGLMEPLVLETARKLEEKFGRGTVKVKQEKQKKSPVRTYSAKKAFNNEDTHRKPFKNPWDDNNISIWRTVDTGNHFGQYERNPSPRDFDDCFISTQINPRMFRERKRGYSDDENSLDSFKQAYLKRSITPPRRELSPNYNSRSSRNISEYRHSSRKRESQDRMGRISPPYEPSYKQADVKRTFDSHNSLQSASFKHQDNYSSSLERSYVDQSRNLTSDKSKTFVDVLQDLSCLSSEDCYNLFYLKLKALPEISTISELLGLTKLLQEAKRKLSVELLPTIQELQRSNSSSDMIPGLDAAPSSSRQFNIRNDNTDQLQQASNSSASYLSELFKNANSGTVASQEKTSPYRLPSSSYTPSASYQVSSGSSHQASANNTYLNQASVPFAPSSVQTYQPNVTPFNSTDNVPLQGRPRVFNYSHFSSTSSSGPKNFSRKF